MRRLSTKAKKSKAEQSSSESTGTEEEKVAAGNGNEASGNESGSEDKPSPKKKTKRGKKTDTSQKANEDGIADEGSEKRKRRSTGAAKSDDNDEESAVEEYEVEKVVDSKVVRGQTQYKIRWKGFSPENDTWEPEEDLNCPELIKEFLNSQPEEAKGKNSKSKKRGGKSSGTEPKSKKKKKDSEEEMAEVDNEEDDEEKVYEVEKVVEVHFKKNGKREFLIRWKGFSSNDDTWEPEENLSCPDLIEKFMAKVDKRMMNVPTKVLKKVIGAEDVRKRTKARNAANKLTKRTVSVSHVKTSDMASGPSAELLRKLRTATDFN